MRYACRSRPARLRNGLGWSAALFTSFAFGLAAAPTALAQGTDLRGLVIDWARGRYNSPLICEIDGEPVRGLRRVLVTPAPRQSTIPTGRVIFVEMDTERAERCFTDLGEDVPNLKGTLEIRLPGPPRADSATRELKNRLKRDNGMTFDIVTGTLVESPVGKPTGNSRRIDFSGGTARFDRLREGSDEARLLADFDSPRKLVLTIRSEAGTSISLPLFLTDFR